MKQPPGVISATEAYTVDEFRKRTGLGDFSWRQVRRDVPIVEIGRKRYVRGKDWLDYLERRANPYLGINPNQQQET